MLSNLDLIKACDRYGMPLLLFYMLQIDDECPLLTTDSEHRILNMD